MTFCQFMKLLQIELHKVAQLCNSHRIRPSANHESPADHPDYLYFIPQSNNTCDHLTHVCDDEVDMAEEHCAKVPSLRRCSPYFNELAELIMEDAGLQMPNTAEGAQELYVAFLRLIDDV